MRILYIDIDSLRPDHLGCHGYHRSTSPNIDALADRGVRFEQVYTSDAPCLPSRTALWSGRFGFHNGVIDHGGPASQPFPQPQRGFRDDFSAHSWTAILQELGYYTATISSFGARHSAWHWYAGYHEILNCGQGGYERADEVTPLALDWLARHGAQENWFLHFNLWDPHTPYRTPPGSADRFAGDPLPEHLTEDYWRAAWEGYGPHSPQELTGFDASSSGYRGLWDGPTQLDSFETVRWWIDHYDAGIRYADDHIGQVLTQLDHLGILNDTLIMVGADHGENLGELNIWGDHQTADAITCRVPLIVVSPEHLQTPRVDSALHYHFDWAATLLELAGGRVPESWDAEPFSQAFRMGASAGREYLVTSQGAWACQRMVRFDYQERPYMLLRTYHDGYKMLDDLMLFDLAADPHEMDNLAPAHPEVVAQGLLHLEAWLTEMMRTGENDVDPMMTVLRQGGGLHTRGQLPDYLARLQQTDRGHHAETLAGKHGFPRLKPGKPKRSVDAGSN